MAKQYPEVILDLSGEVEVFPDPDQEVFFGPVTQREREIRKQLPRRTLHPCEVLEISKRGMTFQEWEDYKEQLQRNEKNEEAINEIFGAEDEEPNTTDPNDQDCKSEKGVGSPNATIESFNSCTSGEDGGESKDVSHKNIDSWNSTCDEPQHISEDQDVSGVTSLSRTLDDTWEIQERMLALAEKLERGEDIPELGICYHASGAIEYKAHSRKQSRDEDQHKEENEITKLVEAKCDSTQHSREHLAGDDNKENTAQPMCTEYTTKIVPKIVTSHVDEDHVSITSEKMEVPSKNPPAKAAHSVDHLSKDMNALTLRQKEGETPGKDPSGLFRLPTPVKKAETCGSRIVLETHNRTPSSLTRPKKPLSTPSQPKSASKSSSRPNSAVRAKSGIITAASPVGMYIRSLPEPILIQNVHSGSKKKEVQTNPAALKPPRIAMKNKDGRWSITRTPSKEMAKSPEQPVEYKAVLPTVLHEAAASVITEVSEVQPSTVTTPGTGGKIGKLLERAVTPTVLKHQGRIQVSKDAAAKTSMKIINSPKSKRPDSTNLMEVSVLEKVSSGKSFIPVRQFPARK